MLLPVYARPLLLAGTAWLVACAADSQLSRGLTARDSSAIEAVRAAYVHAGSRPAGVLATLIRRCAASSRSTACHRPWCHPAPGRSGGRLMDLAPLSPLSSGAWTSWQGPQHESSPTPGGFPASHGAMKKIRQARAVDAHMSLTVFAPGADGQWRILRQMWGPALRQ